MDDQLKKTEKFIERKTNFYLLETHFLATRTPEDFSNEYTSPALHLGAAIDLRWVDFKRGGYCTSKWIQEAFSNN